jgi:superfamily II DNA or RNA helicase
MPADLAPLVDVRDIVRLVGQGAFQRGREYARDAAVSEIDWDAESGLLSSTVRGSLEHPYRCHIELAPARDGYHRPMSGNCSCPLMADCKHVAATLLECNTIHLREPVSSRALGAGGVTRGSDLVTKGVATDAVTAPPVRPDWKSALGALTDSSTAGGGTRDVGSADPRTGVIDPAIGAETPLALQFELRLQTPRSRDRWRGPTAIPATSRVAGMEYRLGVRPAVLSAAGNWVRGNVTWNSLGYQTNRLSLEASHQRWFAQFSALYRATTRDVYTGQDTDWIYLDEFHSGLLWHLLEEAGRLGIEFIGSKKDATVSVGREARVELDATRAPDGALNLAPLLTIDGHPHPALAAGAIGDHGVYVTGFSPTTFVVAPTAAPLTGEQRLLLGGESTVAIPGDDAAEFLSEYYPVLRRSITVSSSDESVALPDIQPPELVLTVVFGRKQTLKARWHWEYPVASAASTALAPPLTVAPVTVPLGAPPSDKRDPQAEAAISARVAAVLDGPPVPVTLGGLDAAEFSSTTLPLLEALDGVRVDTKGARPDYRELTEVPELVFTTVETEHRDWFDLGVLVSIEGRKVPFGPLFAALSKGHEKLLLVDNSYLSLKQPVFAELLRLITEASALAEWETDAPKISRYQASLWAEFEDLADETEQAVSWRATAAGLLAADGVEPAPLPTGLAAVLRPYQRDGYDWLAFLWQHGLGGVLADDMGLGKTLQALALIAHAREVGTGDDRAPFLVVAPTSVVSNWVAEAQRFTPGLVVRGITATDAKSRAPLAELVVGADVIITSYAIFRLDLERYHAQSWAGLILDEAQFVKNPASKAHEAAVQLKAPFKLAITGTPMENSLTDLWSLFQIVAPGLFPSHRRFTDDYVKPITSSAADESPRGAELLAQLRRRIRPLMMRRTKDIVATELPAKQEQVLRIDLAPRHKTLYDTFLQRERQKLLGLIDDLDKNRFIVFRSLTLLRMLSLDASLVDEKYSDIPSSKLDALFEQLDDVVAEGHRALIFSQFTSFLKKAAARLEVQGIPFEYLDGGTTKRADVIARFKKGDAPVFLISLKAGGFGLNLTEADYVFMLDPWWNPASENQAIDRAHRIGQDKNVMVYRMVASGTIEEKVMALKEQKSRLFDAVMDDDAVFSSALTSDDIRGLLEQ